MGFQLCFTFSEQKSWIFVNFLHKWIDYCEAMMTSLFAYLYQRFANGLMKIIWNFKMSYYSFSLSKFHLSPSIY